MDRINNYTGLLSNLYDFQTLIAAVIAFAAAFLAFGVQRRAVVVESRRRAMSARVRAANLLADIQVHREKMYEMKIEIEADLSPSVQAVLPFNEPPYRLPKFVDANALVEGYADVVNKNVVEAIITYRTYADELRSVGLETPSGVIFNTARRARGLANTGDVVDDETVLARLDEAIAANDDLQVALTAASVRRNHFSWLRYIPALTSRRFTPPTGST